MSNSIIKLPAELTIAQVEEFKLTIIKLVDENDQLAIDDSDIIRIDTTGLQLIIAIILYVLSLNKTLDWQCNAACISESINQLGVNEAILNQYVNV
jgi:anti-anti-sigma regulatory factor